MSDSQVKYRCLIVDDEILAQDLIEEHLYKIPQFEVIGKCQSAAEALTHLQTNTVDVLFLDIQMTDISGIEFLKSIPNPPVTVFTTAYSEYAVEGYNLNVVDYLLKPITFERFFQAISKVLDQLKSLNILSKEEDFPDFTTKAIFVKSNYKVVKVKFDEILYIEGMQKYVKFHLNGKMVTTLMSLAKLEEVLPRQNFFRGHKSYIINLSKIDSIAGNDVTISDTEIPISKNIKEELMNRLDNFNLL